MAMVPWIWCLSRILSSKNLTSNPFLNSRCEWQYISRTENYAKLLTCQAPVYCAEMGQRIWKAYHWDITFQALSTKLKTSCNYALNLTITSRQTPCSSNQDSFGMIPPFVHQNWLETLLHVRGRSFCNLRIPILQGSTASLLHTIDDVEEWQENHEETHIQTTDVEWTSDDPDPVAISRLKKSSDVNGLLMEIVNIHLSIHYSSYAIRETCVHELSTKGLYMTQRFMVHEWVVGLNKLGLVERRILKALILTSLCLLGTLETMLLNYRRNKANFWR